MKLFALLLALSVSSCALFNSNTPKPPDPKQVRLQEISVMTTDLMNRFILPDFQKQTSTGFIVLDEAIITSDLVYSVVKFQASNSKGHIGDLYFTVICDLEGCSATNLFSVMDLMAEERLTPEDK